MKTKRLTVAQAIVEFLQNQYIEVDGRQSKFVRGVFTLFGHGNVLGLGQALEENPGDLLVVPGRNEQGMAPEQFAGLVFDAIRNKKLYLLSHPEFNDRIQERAENILQERNPEVL